MSKKHILKEQLNRIQQIMGVNESLLIENPVPIPKIFIKKILKDSDDVGEVLAKLFNLSDKQIDNLIAQIDRVGVDNLSDDVLEALAKNTIDNVDDFVKLLKSGKYLGSNFDELSITILNRVEDLGEITPQTRQRVIDLYKQKLDGLPFLENAKEVKEKLVRDFQSEFDIKFSDKILRATASSLDNELDNLFNQTERIMGQLDNVVGGIPANTPGREKIQTAWKRIFKSRESVYDEIKRRAGYIDPKEFERAGNIKGMKDAEIERLLTVSGDPMITPRDAELVKAISAAQNANYFTATKSLFKQLPKAVQVAFWTVLISGGSALSLGSSIIKILVGLMDVGSQKLDTIKVTSDLISLNNENIISHLSSELNIPKDIIKGWEIEINNNKLSAIVENPASDGKIYKVTLVTNENEPEKNYIKSQEI
jgi:hypothetical protein